MAESERPVDRAPAASPLPLDEPAVDKFDLTQDREETRHLFGLILLALFAVTVLGSLAALFVGAIDATALKDILAIVIPPEVSLLGAVLGFYYGTKSGGSGSS